MNQSEMYLKYCYFLCKTVKFDAKIARNLEKFVVSILPDAIEYKASHCWFRINDKTCDANLNSSRL